MTILDTHIFIWAYNSQHNKIPRNMLVELERSDALGVCGISLWEVAMLVQKGRVILSCELREWFRRVFAWSKIKLLPINPEIAAKSGELNMQRDPADRLIAATSVCYDYCLATVDRELRALDFLKTIQY